jgi:BlaI family transcriptional regulator, penicillinase repressor
MSRPPLSRLSRREREIMNTLFAMDEASAVEVARALDDEDCYDSIRVTLGILERKGYARHRREGKRYVYRPAISHEKARQAAMNQLTEVFFKGSASRAILAYLERSFEHLSADEFEEIAIHAREMAESKEMDSGR